MLREKTKESSNAKSFDFEQRLAQIKAKDAAVRKQRKDLRKARKSEQADEVSDEISDLAHTMGFRGFSSSKR